jgi:hypothetical protein
VVIRIGELKGRGSRPNEFAGRGTEEKSKARTFKNLESQNQFLDDDVLE